jgi:hypothetical protein
MQAGSDSRSCPLACTRPPSETGPRSPTGATRDVLDVSGAELALSHGLRVGLVRMLPYWLDTLREELGITVENTEDATRLHPASEQAVRARACR